MPCRFDRCHEALAPDALAIFLFHGVIPRQVHEVRNYTRKHLQEAEFDAALRTLKAHGHPMSMPEVLETLERGGRFPPRDEAGRADCRVALGGQRRTVQAWRRRGRRSRRSLLTTAASPVRAPSFTPAALSM